MLNQLNELVYLFRRNNWIADPRFHLNDYQNLEIDRPIFLLGNQGGGLTLLSRILRRNKAAVSPSGNSAYWSGADELQNVFGPALPRELTGLRHKAPHHDILSPPRSWTYAADELLPLYRNDESDYTQSLEKDFKHILRYILNRWGKAGNPRFVDKSQVYTVKLGLIHALLKNNSPKFVLMTRNPFIECPRAADGKAGDMRRYKKFMSWEDRLELCIQHWKNGIEAVSKDESRLGLDVHKIKFEELLVKPDEHIRAICDFTGLEFSVDMLPDAGHRIPIGSHYRNRWFPLKKDINSQYLGRYSRRTIELLDEKLGSAAAALGYTNPY